MGRRRVLVLAPAITRMQCMGNPYKRIEGGGDAVHSGAAVGSSKPPESEQVAAAVRAPPTTSFWSSWRKKRAAKKKRGARASGSGATGARRVRGFRVTKLRIRMLSPLFWLKKLRDSYVNMMLAIERSAPRDCTGMVAYPEYMYQANAGGAWVFPALPPPVVF